MSKGKYSPTMYRIKDTEEYIYNAKGELPPLYTSTDEYNEEIHFADYDKDGFDGYSVYDANGNFVGLGRGVDRNGVTEEQYSAMSDNEFNSY